MDPNWTTYAEWSGRYSSQSDQAGNRLYWTIPIEQVEAALELAREQLIASRPPIAPIPDSPNSPPNYLDRRSPTERVMDSLRLERMTASTDLQKWTRITATLRGALHDWLSRAVIELQYGAVIDSAFQRAKARFDALLASHAPDVAAALAAAFARANTSDPEEASQAFTSCRRALKALADTVYPATDEIIEGHALTDAGYVNRLARFAADRLSSTRERQLVQSDIDAVAAQAEALNNLANQGIHSVADIHRLEMVVTRTYLLAGELLQLLPPPDDSPGSEVPQVEDLSDELEARSIREEGLDHLEPEAADPAPA